MKHIKLVKQVMELTQGFETMPCASLDAYEFSIESDAVELDALTHANELRLEAEYHRENIDLGDHLKWAGVCKGKRGL